MDMEEKLRLKMKQRYEWNEKRYKKTLLAISLVLGPIAMIPMLIIVVQSSGWSEVPLAIVKMIFVCVFGGFLLYKAINRTYRCLNRKHYYFFEAYVIKKKYVDESIDYVGIENKMRIREKRYYLLLNNDEHYTKASVWAYRDVQENERYLFAIAGKKRRKRSVIVGALKID